ncbi:MAG: hypothetical protein RIE86_08875 [Imperialibacter sp.]|uniref:hypothetical protein n=1 Tax=Imperialibacter sp. TaxID=2038411 RepID=UPI0032ECF79C
MNKLSNLFTATTIFALIIFISCGGKDDPGTTEPDPVAERLALLLNGGTEWAVAAGAVKQDGVAATEWDGFGLKFTGSGSSGSYTATGRPATSEVPNVDVVWPASGTWSFGDGATAGEKDISKIVRSDGVTMAASVTSTKLSLTFTIEDTGAGRMQGVAGTWVFEFPN